MQTTIDLSSKTFQLNPWPTYSYLRARDPLHWSPPNRCFFLLKYKHVRQALDSQDFSVEHPFRASRQVFGSTLLDLDGSDHQRLRAIAEAKFKPPSVKSYAINVIEPVVHRLLDQISEKGRADFMSDFAFHIPIQVMAHIMGVPVEDSSWLYNQLRPLVQYLDYPRTGLEEAMLARENLDTYIEKMLEQHQKTPQADTVITQLIRAHTLDQVLDQGEIFRTILLLLVAGTETTVATIGNTLVCLLTHTDFLAKVQKDPTLIPFVIRETIRWEPPQHTVLRFATKDLEIDGVFIRRGTPVQLSIASANRDEDHYKLPDVWKPLRAEHSFLSFGSGRHSCLGFSLAYKELEIVFRLLFERLKNLEVEGGTIPPIQGRVFRRPHNLHLRFQTR